MVKRRNTRKGKGWFHKKKSVSRKSNKLSDVNYNKEGEYYDQAIYAIIYNTVNNYARSGKLAKGYSSEHVDAILSKYVDEPRNIDGLIRAKKWTEYLLNTKYYAKNDKAFKKELFKLKHISLI